MSSQNWFPNWCHFSANSEIGLGKICGQRWPRQLWWKGIHEAFGVRCGGSGHIQLLLFAVWSWANHFASQGTADRIRDEKELDQGRSDLPAWRTGLCCPSSVLNSLMTFTFLFLKCMILLMCLWVCLSSAVIVPAPHPPFRVLIKGTLWPTSRQGASKSPSGVGCSVLALLPPASCESL